MGYALAAAAAAVGAIVLAVVPAVTAADIAACSSECSCTRDFSGKYDVRCASTNPWSSDPTGTLTFPLDTTKISLTSTGLTCLACGSAAAKRVSLHTNLVNSSVVELNIGNNQLLELAAGDLTGLWALELLDARNNDIAKIINGAFDQTPKLKKIILQDNKITSLARGVFNKLLALENLDLSINLLVGLPASPGIFELNVALRRLDLTKNLLTSDSQTGVQDGAFAGLSGLTTFIMQDNRLTTIRDDLLVDLSQVEEVNLMGNLITEVTSGVFGNASTLKELQLANNKLVEVTSKATEAIAKVQKLKAGGHNQWDCCKLDWMLQMVEQVSDVDSVVCSRPEPYHGQSLKSTQVSGWSAETACTQNEPSTPYATQFVSSTSTSLKVEWSKVEGNAFAVDTYQLQYAPGGRNPADLVWRAATCAAGAIPPGVDADLTVSSDCLIAASGAITYTLNQLELNKYTEYWFRVRARNPLNGGTWSAAGPATSMMTAEDTPGAVVEPTLSSPTPTTILANWTAPTAPNGVIIKYVAQLTDYTGKVHPGVEPEPRNGTSLTFENLTPAQNYSVSVTAFTYVGEGAPSSTARVKTMDAKPYRPLTRPYLIENPGTDTKTSTSLHLTWPEPPAESRNGHITGYSVYAVPNPKANQDGRTIEGIDFAAGANTNRILTNLAPSTTYAISYTVWTSAGESTESPTFSVQTLDAAPTGQPAPVSNASSSTSLDISWSGPEKPNGIIVGYTLSVIAVAGGAGSSKNLTDKFTVSARGDQNSVAVPQLTAATNYELRVASSTLLAQSNFSSAIFVQTLDDMPAAVPCTAATLSATKIRIEWAEPTTTNGKILQYQVVQVEKRRTVALYEPIIILEDAVVHTWNASSGGDFIFEHAALNPYTRYTYSVRAQTSRGGWSALDIQSAATTSEATPTGQSPPTVRVLGSSSVQVVWSLPEMPNGELTKFEMHSQQGEGDVPVYTGIPATTLDRKRVVNITGLTSATSYAFTITAFTQVGSGPRSDITVVETEDTLPDVKTATLIAVICVAVCILSLGFMWEHKVRGGFCAKEGTEVKPESSKQYDMFRPQPLAALPHPGGSTQVPPAARSTNDPFRDTAAAADPFAGLGAGVFSQLDSRPLGSDSDSDSDASSEESGA